MITQSPTKGVELARNNGSKFELKAKPNIADPQTRESCTRRHGTQPVHSTVKPLNNTSETISSFLAEIKSLLNPLLSLLTVLINKIAVNFQ